MPPFRVPSVKPRVAPKPPRIQPGGPRPSVPTRPNPKAPTVKPKPKPRPSAGGVVAAGAAGSFLPSLINTAGGVANTAVITDAIKEFGEYVVDNPWALAVIGGVVVIFLIR